MSKEEAQSHESVDELEILSHIVASLKKIKPDRRQKVIQSVFSVLNIHQGNIEEPAQDVPRHTQSKSDHPVRPSFSEDRSISPKSFILEKDPASDVERVACLAYYLTHYRQNPHFKTIDISKINTEAAQRKLSNAGYAVDNATKQGYLVPASKGSKQLSGVGEKFVQLLPDRSAAKEAMAKSRQKRPNKGNGK